MRIRNAAYPTVLILAFLFLFVNLFFSQVKKTQDYAKDQYRFFIKSDNYNKKLGYYNNVVGREDNLKILIYVPSVKSYYDNTEYNMKQYFKSLINNETKNIERQNVIDHFENNGKNRETIDNQIKMLKKLIKNNNSFSKSEKSKMISNLNII